MADKDFDPFKLTTGLPDELDVVIRNSWFEFDDEYNDGQTLVMKMEVASDSDEWDDDDALKWPCGDGWETDKEGVEAKREDGKQKGFHVNSGIGQLLASALDIDDLREELKRRYDEDDNGPLQAAMWEGLNLKLERKVFTGTIGGEDREWSRLLVTEYHGNGADGDDEEEEKPKPAKAGSRKKKASKKAPTKKATGRKRAPKKADAALPDVVDEETVTQLTEMAAEHEDTESFIDAVYEEFEFDEDDEELATWLEGFANDNIS